MVYAHYPAREGAVLLPAKAVRARTGDSKSKQYRDINELRHPAPIKTGPRSTRLPDWVVDDYNAARATGEEFDAKKYIEQIGGELYSVDIRKPK